MEITYAGQSSAGRVRTNNEDSLDFWQPASPEEWRTRGAVAILADGVGGHGDGEIASQLACSKARQAFTEAKAGCTPNQLLHQMFSNANLAVYDQGMKQRIEGRMLTTLTISVMRHNEIAIGHVGDCRVYAVQGSRIRRVTSDHSYAGVQLKLGLITVQEAMNSPFRSVLTRAVGQEPMIRADYHTLSVSHGDFIIQATDGLWCYLTENEIHDFVSKQTPENACREMIALAEKRGGQDNLTLQVIRIDSVERPSYYRGQTVYQKVEPARMGQELEAGQTLDG
ncbi:MAG TPA: protein phosphatase 2C domain-containing protein, partial [Humisphaera sp.]|nr:protein phosphatase 2C domain-containing protein [Humisphaera sp.]